MSSTHPGSASVGRQTSGDFDDDLGLNNSNLPTTPFDNNLLSPYNHSEPNSNSASPSSNIGSTPGEDEYSTYQASEFSEGEDPFFGVNFDAGVARIDSGFHVADLNRPLPDLPAQVQHPSATFTNSIYPLSPPRSYSPNLPSYDNDRKRIAESQHEQTILLQNDSRMPAFSSLAPIHGPTLQLTPDISGCSHTSDEGIEPSTMKRSEWSPPVFFQRDNEHSKIRTPGKVTDLAPASHLDNAYTGSHVLERSVKSNRTSVFNKDPENLNRHSEASPPHQKERSEPKQLLPHIPQFEPLTTTDMKTVEPLSDRLKAASGQTIANFANFQSQDVAICSDFHVRDSPHELEAQNETNQKLSRHLDAVAPHTNPENVKTEFKNQPILSLPSSPDLIPDVEASSEDSSDHWSHDAASFTNTLELSDLDEVSWEECVSVAKRLELVLISLIGAARYNLFARLMRSFEERYGKNKEEDDLKDAESHVSGSGSGLGSGAGSSDSHSLASGSTPPKRKSRGKEDEQDDDGELPERAQKKPRKAGDISLSTQRKLACPYHKRDRATFGLGTCFELCATSGWKDIGHLKEHLYRRHHCQLQCQRCKAPFYSQLDLDRHAEAATPCHPRARELRDGFTAETHVILHRKKRAFPGQNDEEKWKEIFQLLFPNRPVPSPYVEDELGSDFNSFNAPGDLESDSVALHEEFRRRATALVASTVNPLEIQLSDQVTRLARESEEAVLNRPQRTQDTGQPDYRMDHSPAIPPTFSSFTHDCMSQSQINLEDNWMMDWTLPSSNGDFDALIDSTVNIHAEAGNALQHSIHSSSSGLGLSSNDSCSCIGECNCQTTPPRQMRLSAIQAQPQTDISLPKDEVIMNILQSLSRSMLALEKRLDAK